MHGAYAGPPRGNRNAWKHGRYTQDLLEFRRILREVVRENAELLERV